MTHTQHPSPAAPSAPERAVRSHAEYRWTQRKALAFIHALAEHGKVAAAARSVGMSRQSAYRLRERFPLLAEEWERAQAHGRERRRARCVTSGRRKVTVSPVQGDGSAAPR